LLQRHCKTRWERDKGKKAKAIM